MAHYCIIIAGKFMSHAQTFLFDTLNFANKLKEVGVEPKVAETQAELQAEVQSKLFDKLSEHEATLCELTKHELATKEDLYRVESRLDHKIDCLDHKVDCLEHKINTKLEANKNDIILRLGRMMASGLTIAVAILGILVTILHYVD